MNAFLSGKFGSHLFGSDQSILGVDVGTSSLKIMQVRKDKERAVLETYGEISTNAYSGGDDGRAAILMDEKVAEMINDLKREAGVTAKRGIISIPLRYSFVTEISMPRLSDSELASAIPLEARRYVPVPISDVVLDWWRVPDVQSEDGVKSNTSTVLLAAVQREVVEKFKRILTASSLEHAGFEIEAFSAARALVGRYRGAVMFIDIGALSTKVFIVHGGVLRSAHGFDRASQSFSLAIAQSLGVEFKRAEEMKKEIGIIPKPESAGITHTLSPLLDAVFDEADRARTSFRRKSGITVDRAVLLGGGSMLPGLAEYAIERLGIEVLMAHPFTRISYPAFLQQTLTSIGPIFSTVTGLALRVLQEE